MEIVRKDALSKEYFFRCRTSVVEGVELLDLPTEPEILRKLISSVRPNLERRTPTPEIFGEYCVDRIRELQVFDSLRKTIGKFTSESLMDMSNGRKVIPAFSAFIREERGQGQSTGIFACHHRLHGQVGFKIIDESSQTLWDSGKNDAFVLRYCRDAAGEWLLFDDGTRIAIKEDLLEPGSEAVKQIIERFSAALDREKVQRIVPYSMTAFSKAA
jgi:hypothetical protein